MGWVDIRRVVGVGFGGWDTYQSGESRYTAPEKCSHKGGTFWCEGGQVCSCRMWEASGKTGRASEEDKSSQHTWVSWDSWGILVTLGRAVQKLWTAGQF